MKSTPRYTGIFRLVTFLSWIAFACCGCANRNYFIPPAGDSESATIQGSFHRFGLYNWRLVSVDEINGQEIKRPLSFPATTKRQAERVLAIPSEPLTITVEVFIYPHFGGPNFRGKGEILFEAEPGHQYIVTGEMHCEQGEAVMWIVEADTETPVSEKAMLELQGLQGLMVRTSVNDCTGPHCSNGICPST